PAIAGPIGFAGPIVPHMCRMLVGTDHRWLLPFSALAGAALLLLSYVLMFVSAFRDKLTAWGILLLLFSPLTMLIYPIFH
ncbi:UNVERIFIED_CONTAM: iron chelate uptake ABC transporter family permease subunit, partial [Salmonella enterica subsp. enterica serovar Weltevreden]